MVEWKYDGIRGQVVKRGGRVWIWSRGEELVTERFPEIVAAASDLPDGTVLDGEIVVWKGDGKPAPFALLQQRIGRKTLTKKVLADAPVAFMAYDLVELARRHPAANFICAHTGGDWERGIRIIRNTKNIWAEMAGFDPTAGVVEMAVRELGPERVVYGSDVGGRSFASQLAKVYGANLSDEARRQILSGNLRRMMAPILKTKGVAV